MEKTGCEIIYGAQTTLTVKGLMMMMRYASRKPVSNTIHNDDVYQHNYILRASLYLLIKLYPAPTILVMWTFTKTDERDHHS